VTNYIKGRAFEYKIKDFLERNNYLVFRMAGSHSVFDLIAIKGSEVKFIQAKEVSNKNMVNHVIKEVEGEFNSIGDYIEILDNIIVFAYLYLKVERDKVYVYRFFNNKLREIGYYDLSLLEKGFSENKNHKNFLDEDKLKGVIL